MSLLEAALHYVENGIPVFPVHGINAKGNCTCLHNNCSHPGKHPVLTGGFKIATRDQQQIITWWGQYPEANIGVPTGRASGWYTVDVDKKNKGIENYKNFVEQHKNDIPPATLKALTGGGGVNLIYAQPSNGQAVGSGTNIGRLEGVDFRGDGGYIVVPPSLHFNQVNYQWHKDFAFNDHPDLALLKPLPAIIANLVNSPANAKNSSGMVLEGGRNTHLFKQACKFRKQGVADEHLFDRVWAENQSACRPSLLRGEVEQIVASALKTEIDLESIKSEPTPLAVGSINVGNGKVDAFTNLMALTTDHEFWSDEAKKQFVTYPVTHNPTSGNSGPHNGQSNTLHYENWAIASSEYRHFLAHQYRQIHQNGAPEKTMDNVLSVLAGNTLFNEVS